MGDRPRPLPCRTRWSRPSATTSSTIIYQKIHNFCVVELGGFYLDIIKDRLYTTGTDSAPRRSAQTAVHHVAQAMVRWIAPILSFTAEEVWGFLPNVPNESVFLNTWHVFPAGAERDPAIDWARADRA